MSPKPFARSVINPLEKPFSQDFNFLNGYSDESLREFILRYINPRSSIVSQDYGTPFTNFLGDSFRVKASSPVSAIVNVNKGLGFFYDATEYPSIGGITGLDDLSLYKPLVLTEDQAFTVPAADPTNPRIDIIEVAVGRELGNPSTRKLFIPSGVGAGGYTPGSVNKTLGYDLLGQTGTVNFNADSTAYLSYKKGSPAGSPSAPSTTAGYVKIAEILVGAATTSWAENKILDLRKMSLGYGGCGFVSGRISVAAGAIATLSELVAPPGVRVGVSKGSIGDTFNFHLFAGAALSHFDPVFNSLGNNTTNFTSTVIYMPVIGTPAIGTVDSTIQADMANATKASPVMDVALGQPVASVIVTTAMLAFGGGYGLSTRDPDLYSFHVGFRY